MEMHKKLTTEEEFRTVLGRCRDLFVAKMSDYGTAWSIMRPSSITDQLFIKACRIRSLEVTGEAKIEEGIAPEFVGLVNYSIMGQILLARYADSKAIADAISKEEASRLYDEYAERTLQLMLLKNHDYGEAWRGMRVSSYTDLILMKLLRTKQIEDHDGKTLVSEGIAANYMDIMNYAVFGLIKLVIEGQD